MSVENCTRQPEAAIIIYRPCSMTASQEANIRFGHPAAGQPENLNGSNPM